MENTLDFMEYVARLSRMLRRQPAAGQHISHSGHKLIGVLLEHDGIRTSELAEKLDIRPSSLTDVLKRLEREEYIHREKDENDSRISYVYVNDKAREAYISHVAERTSQKERLRACLTDEEAKTFCEICDKLCSFLGEEYPQEHPHEDDGYHKRHREHGGHHDHYHEHDERPEDEHHRTGKGRRP